MKKLIIAALLLMGSTIITKAHQEESLRFKVELSVRNDKPVYGGIPVPKSPVIPPDVWLDDHTLYIDSIGCDCTVQLTDASNVVVCSVFVPDGTTVVQLPSTLSGTYELSIIPDSGSYYLGGSSTAAVRRMPQCVFLTIVKAPGDVIGGPRTLQQILGAVHIVFDTGEELPAIMRRIHQALHVTATDGSEMLADMTEWAGRAAVS